jgi:hypothetical protein
MLQMLLSALPWMGNVLLIALAAMALTEGFKRLIGIKFDVSRGIWHRLKPVAPIFWGAVVGLVWYGLASKGATPTVSTVPPIPIQGLAGGLIAPFVYSFIKTTLRPKK